MSDKTLFRDVQIGETCTIQIDGKDQVIRRVKPQMRHREGEIFNARVVKGIHKLASVSQLAVVTV